MLALLRSFYAEHTERLNRRDESAAARLNRCRALLKQHVAEARNLVANPGAHVRADKVVEWREHALELIRSDLTRDAEARYLKIAGGEAALSLPALKNMHWQTRRQEFERLVNALEAVAENLTVEDLA